jgi:hypothetical protein
MLTKRSVKCETWWKGTQRAWPRQARRIVLMALGEGKAAAVARAVEGPVTDQVRAARPPPRTAPPAPGGPAALGCRAAPRGAEPPAPCAPIRAADALAAPRSRRPSCRSTPTLRCTSTRAPRQVGALAAHERVGCRVGLHQASSEVQRRPGLCAGLSWQRRAGSGGAARVLPLPRCPDVVRHAARHASRAAQGSREPPGLDMCAEASTKQVYTRGLLVRRAHQAAPPAALAGAQAALPARASRSDPGPEPVAARRHRLGRGARAGSRHLAGARAGPAAAAPDRRRLCRALAAGTRRAPAVKIAGEAEQ